MTSRPTLRSSMPVTASPRWTGPGRGVATGQIAAAEGVALHAAAVTGMPDPVLHRAARAMGVVTGLAALEPGPRAPGADVLLDAALQAATGLQQLLTFRHDCTTVTTAAEQAAATARLTSAAAELGKAAEALRGLIELAEMTGRSGRTGKTDLNLVQPRQGRQAPPSPPV
jgi:hypothetical protein